MLKVVLDRTVGTVRSSRVRTFLGRTDFTLAHAVAPF